MAGHLSPSWCEILQDDIRKYGEEHIPFKRTTAIAQAKRYVVLQLAQRNIPFRVINLGCGVTTITTETDTCPKCGGTGRC
jgi:hypothetical protein